MIIVWKLQHHDPCLKMRREHFTIWFWVQISNKFTQTEDVGQWRGPTCARDSLGCVQHGAVERCRGEQQVTHVTPLCLIGRQQSQPQFLQVIQCRLRVVTKTLQLLKCWIVSYYGRVFRIEILSIRFRDTMLGFKNHKPLHQAPK